MRLTKNRMELLNIIRDCSIPVNVKFLKKKVPFNVSTIYRSLDFLERNNYIYSFNIHNETYYFKEHDGNFFVCGLCSRIEPLPEISGYFEPENEKLKEKGFSLVSHLSIFKGICTDCNN